MLKQMVFNACSSIRSNFAEYLLHIGTTCSERPCNHFNPNGGLLKQVLLYNHIIKNELGIGSLFSRVLVSLEYSGQLSSSNWVPYSFKYCQTCLQRPPLGVKKSVPCRQVAALYRAIKVKTLWWGRNCSGLCGQVAALERWPLGQVWL